MAKRKARYAGKEMAETESSQTLIFQPNLASKVTVKTSDIIAMKAVDKRNKSAPKGKTLVEK
jgi:hypothetical protein